MSILIKGMRMPSCCDGCTFSDWSNLHQTASCKLHDYDPCFADHSREYGDKRADFCPLVEIPVHGRLIDADALIKKCGDWYVEEGTESGFIGTLKNLLATEPTIQPEKAQLYCEGTTKGTTSDTISRQAAIDAIEKNACNTQRIMDAVNNLPSAQPELIEKTAYIRGFEQGRTQGMIDSQGGKK